MGYLSSRYVSVLKQSLIVLMSQWFAPTSLSISFEKEGMGGLTDQEIESMLVKDDSGRVVGLQFPNKLVIIANHQVRLPRLDIILLVQP